jgi:hypothetical protein
MQLGKLTALTGVIIISVAVIMGCSNDKSTTVTPNYGSLDDPQFVPVKTQIDDALDVLIEDILAGFDNLYVSPGDTSSVQANLTPPFFQPDPEIDPDIIVAVYENGWHIVHASYTGDIYHSAYIDSIMFMVVDAPVQEPSPEVDFIHHIDNWAFTAINQDATHVDFEGRNEFQLADLDQSVAVINGTTHNSVDTYFAGDDTTMTSLFVFDIDVNDLNIPKLVGQWLTACPLSGSLDVTLANTFEWTNATTSGGGSVQWTVNVTFNNGVANVTASNGSVTWLYGYQVCSIPSD